MHPRSADMRRDIETEQASSFFLPFARLKINFASELASKLLAGAKRKKTNNCNLALSDCLLHMSVWPHLNMTRKYSRFLEGPTSDVIDSASLLWIKLLFANFEEVL